MMEEHLSIFSVQLCVVILNVLPNLRMMNILLQILTTSPIHFLEFFLENVFQIDIRSPFYRVVQVVLSNYQITVGLIPQIIEISSQFADSIFSLFH
jgi:hypothetical protein